MRSLIDSNVLVAVTMKEHSEHEPSRILIHRVLGGDSPWSLSWINVYEFLRIVTHRRVFPKPLEFEEAFAQVETLLAHPAYELLQETSRHPHVLSATADSAWPVVGSFIHDGHIAALLVEHDVRVNITFDTQFGGSLEVLSPQEALHGFLDQL